MIEPKVNDFCSKKSQLSGAVNHLIQLNRILDWVVGAQLSVAGGHGDLGTLFPAARRFS